MYCQSDKLCCVSTSTHVSWEIDAKPFVPQYAILNEI